MLDSISDICKPKDQALLCSYNLSQIFTKRVELSSLRATILFVFPSKYGLHKYCKVSLLGCRQSDSACDYYSTKWKMYGSLKKTVLSSNYIECLIRILSIISPITDASVQYLFIKLTLWLNRCKM